MSSLVMDALDVKVAIRRYLLQDTCELILVLTATCQCDEVRPKCSACVRLDETCQYRVAKSPRSRAGRDSRAASSVPSPNPPPPQEHVSTPSISQSFPVTPATTRDDASVVQAGPQETRGILHQSTCTLDLELMAALCLGDLSDVFPSSGNGPDLSRKIMRLAMATPFLMHQMLALSAFRLFADDTNRKELMIRASCHQNEALILVKPYLGSATEEHSLALLFFSSLAAVSSLAEPALSIDDTQAEDFDPIEITRHAFQLSRGIMTVVAPFWFYIRQTWAWPAIQSEIEAGNDVTPQPKGTPAYVYLRSLAFGLENAEARQACLDAGTQILESISLMQQRKDASMSRRIVTSWPAVTDAVFHSLLAERRPVALVILAHYAAALHLGTGLWWIGRWPIVLFSHIEKVLGAEWTDFLEWPKSIIFGQED